MVLSKRLAAPTVTRFSRTDENGFIIAGGKGGGEHGVGGGPGGDGGIGCVEGGTDGGGGGGGNASDGPWSKPKRPCVRSKHSLLPMV